MPRLACGHYGPIDKDCRACSGTPDPWDLAAQDEDAEYQAGQARRNRQAHATFIPNPVFRGA